MRIQDHKPHLVRVERGLSCRVTVDGCQVEAFIGETVATVLLANGRFPTPENHAGQPGLCGYFCGIGICYGCQMLVDGRLQRACATAVQPGMVISTRLESET